MKLNNKVMAATLGLTLAASGAFADDESTHSQEITVQGTGSFLKNTTKDGVQQSASNTGGFLASYRFLFNQHNGVELNYGVENNTQRFGAGGSIAGVETRSHEASAAYVFRVPMKRVTPFALAGVGGLIFDPKNFAGANMQARAAFVYGAGADIHLANHWFVRGEYRGFVYNSPTYDISALNGTDRVTHRAEPSVGFGFKF